MNEFDNWNIEEFVKDIDALIVDDILPVIGAQMVTWMEIECPKVTKNLSYSLGYSTEKESSPMSGNTDGRPLDMAEKYEVRVGSNVVYFPRVVNGFVGMDSLGRSYNQVGNPFPQKVLANHKEDIKKIISVVLQNG
jgi:hypothetical protein